MESPFAGPPTVKGPSTPPPIRSPIPSPLLAGSKPDREAFERLRSMVAAASSRESLATAVLTALATLFDSALLFRIQDNAAAGWVGAGRGIDAARIPGLAFELPAGSAFRQAVEEKQPVAVDVSGTNPHAWFYAALHCAPPKSAIVAPVVLRGRVVNLIYGDSRERADTFDHAPLLAGLAADTAAAYERILVASRPKS
jgi:hypothetical protein